MDERSISHIPAVLESIKHDTESLGFKMSSDSQTGSLLATLAASKPSGHFLELGTGTGHGAAWILAGMDSLSALDTVESDEKLVAVAKKHLGHDSRVEFHVLDGAIFIEQAQGRLFDFIYADTWPGKFSHLDETLALLKTGGFYVIDDLLPQPTWPDNHAPRVPELLNKLESRSDLRLTQLCWASGLMIVSKK